MTTSYNESYVKRDTRRTRDLILSDWYRERWPHVRLTRTGEASFANDSGGWREGVPFKSLTGGRGDRVVLDDPTAPSRPRARPIFGVPFGSSASRCPRA